MVAGGISDIERTRRVNKTEAKAVNQLSLENYFSISFRTKFGNANIPRCVAPL